HPPADAPPAAPGADAEPVLDEARLLERVGGDAELLRELATMFLEDCPRMMGEIESAVGLRDGDAVSRAAHALKGSIGNFVTWGPFEAAQRLEVLGREGDVSGLGEAWVALRDA